MKTNPSKPIVIREHPATIDGAAYEFESWLKTYGPMMDDEMRASVEVIAKQLSAAAVAAINAEIAAGANAEGEVQ